MLTIVVEKNQQTIWGPEGEWVAFTDNYDADQPEYREAYGETKEEALAELLDMFDDINENMTLIIDGKWYDGMVLKGKTPQ